MKIGTKLFLGFLAVIIIFLIGLMILFTRLQAVEENVSTMDSRAERSLNLSEIRSLHRGRNAQILDYYVDQNPQFIEKYKGRIATMEQLLIEIEDDMHTDDQKQLHATVVEANQIINDTFLNEMVPVINNGDFEQAFQLNQSILTERNVIVDSIDQLIALVTEERQQAVEVAYKEITSSIYALIVVTLLSLLIGLCIALYMGRKISAPIKLIQDRMVQIADGDLTIEPMKIRSKDEIGQLSKAANNMLASLRKVISDLLESANNLAASSEEISASTEEIASGSQIQANNANKASDMVNEMSHAIEAVSKNAEEASSSSDNTVASAVNGGAVIHDTLKGMDKISEKIAELSSKSIQIGEIIEVIDDIAEQTNLLALNAAIEAARAGEAGKGFAVVADEVRKLAERSSKATKEISELIQSIQANTDASVEAVDSGNEKANNAGQAFEEIIDLVKIAASKVTEIAAASEQQNSQSREVLAAVESIVSVSEQTAAGIQETAASAQDLAEMAETLTQVASRFRV